jgi:Domain of unknown function (DUF4383)
MSMLGLKNLPEDHRFSRVYRFGAGVIGAGLLVFGVLGFVDQLAFFDIEGDRVAGLSTNAVLSTISVVVGLVLIAGALIGGNVASLLNTLVGCLFLVSGFANMCVLRTSWNVLNFSMANVIFSFVVGIALLTFGLYGRVSGGLPPDNPYYRARHGMDPATGEVVDEEKAATASRLHGDETPAPRAHDEGTDPRQLTRRSDAEGG